MFVAGILVPALCGSLAAAVSQDSAASEKTNVEVKAFDNLFFGMSKAEVDKIKKPQGKIGDIVLDLSCTYVKIGGIERLGSVSLSKSAESFDDVRQELNEIVAILTKSFGDPNWTASAWSYQDSNATDDILEEQCSWEEKNKRKVAIYFGEKIEMTDGEKFLGGLIKGKQKKKTHYSYRIVCESPQIRDLKLNEASEIFK